MIVLKQNTDRCVIVLHEIYGINQHIMHYANIFYEENFDVYVPNLLNRVAAYSYEEEEVAYQNFMDDVGFEQAFKQIMELIDELSTVYSHIHIIGFSVGATVAWLCSGHTSVQKVVGFYGSRIRQYTNIVPRANVILIYGEQEKSFQPRDLENSLLQYSNVFVEIVDGEHGFADPFSATYNEYTTNNIFMKHMKSL